MKRLLPIAVSLLLAGCPQSEQPASDAKAPPPPAEEPAATGDADILDGHRWKLESATDAQGQRIDALFPGTDRGLTMNFEAGNVGISGGCNRLGGSYEFDDQGRLTIDRLRSTMMACDPPLMAVDEAIGKLLAQPQQVRVEESAPPRLRMASATGESSSWIGEASAQTRFGGPGERVFLEVAPQRVACNHPLIPDHRCLRVREIRYDDNGIKQSPPGEWRLLYEDIEGYTHEAGVRNVLRLDRFTRDPAPADASSVVYVLDMVVESEVVPEDGTE